jgi:putative ABC transport system permease protein
MMLGLAARNIFRNRRRSIMTLTTVCVGAVAILIFGGFMNYMVLGYQTSTVERTGHLSISRTGYFDYGAGNAAAYSVDRYQDVLELVRADPVLSPLIAVATPKLAVVGIAGNYAADASKTFFGDGVVPADGARMQRWNDYGLGRAGRFDEQPYLLKDGDIEGGVVGTGLAKILGLCEPLKIAECPPPPQKRLPPKTEVATIAPEDFSALVAESDLGAKDEAVPAQPQIDLLASTSGGTPNVVNVAIRGAIDMGVKAIDDNFVLMNLERAQQLIYGRNAHEVTSIVLQLHHTADIPAARARLVALFMDKGLNLEVHDFTELVTEYKQVQGLYQFIFLFISVIMVIIVLFTVVNTTSMGVMERTAEIGTLRALGVQRSGIRSQFIAEGWLLGLIGATLGLVIASLITVAVNNASFTFTPPGIVRPIPFALYMFGDGAILAGTWFGLTVIAAIAASVPANRAARMQIVDALRHV